MGLNELKNICAYLGPMYSIRVIDGVESICRKINDSLEFEVTGFFGGACTAVNLWQRQPHTELLAIYTDIRSKEDLADTLGYLAFKYQNLQEKIRVEREDPIR